MPPICLDTGVLGLMLTADLSPAIINLRTQLQNGTLQALVVKPVLCELFYHICQLRGKDIASTETASLIRRFSIELIDLDESLINLAGTLKCQHRLNLSYIDCMSIALCLNLKIPFHTTEKLLKKIPDNTLQKLSVVKYSF